MLFFFFNDTATTEIYTLSLHDALPILAGPVPSLVVVPDDLEPRPLQEGDAAEHLLAEDRVRLHEPLFVLSKGADRKSTRLNSSHANISYAVFCLKKKKNTTKIFVTISH